MHTLTEAFVLILLAVAAGIGVLALLREPKPEPQLCPHCLGRGRLWWKNAELDQIALEDPCKRCNGEGMVRP